MPAGGPWAPALRLLVGPPACGPRRSTCRRAPATAVRLLVGHRRSTCAPGCRQGALAGPACGPRAVRLLKAFGRSPACGSSEPTRPCLWGRGAPVLPCLRDPVRRALCWGPAGGQVGLGAGASKPARQLSRPGWGWRSCSRRGRASQGPMLVGPPLASQPAARRPRRVPLWGAFCLREGEGARRAACLWGPAGPA